MLVDDAGADHFFDFGHGPTAPRQASAACVEGKEGGRNISFMRNGSTARVALEQCRTWRPSRIGELHRECGGEQRRQNLVGSVLGDRGISGGAGFAMHARDARGAWITQYSRTPNEA